MKKLKIYLDTSAIGYLDEPTSPKEMSEMQALWQLIQQGEYDVIISDVTLLEINDNQNLQKVQTLESFLEEINYERIDLNEEVKQIAESVKRSGLLPSNKHKNDRYHIGCAIVARADVLVSMNFKHLVNIQTIKGVKAVSIAEGYGYIEIVAPIVLINKREE